MSRRSWWYSGDVDTTVFSLLVHSAKFEPHLHQLQVTRLSRPALWDTCPFGPISTTADCLL